VRITNGVANTFPGDFGRELERGCKGGVEERKKREEKKKKKKKKMETAERRGRTPRRAGGSSRAFMLVGPEARDG
jgi:hypothetical protein